MIDLPVRILVVEDDPDWYGDMKSAIKQSGLSADFVSIGRDAEEYLEKKHYHLVSLDQKIPQVHGGALSLKVGVELTSSIRSQYPLTDMVVYTAYDKTEIGAGAGPDVPILHKNELDGLGTCPDEWAREVSQRLENYLPFYFQRAGDTLPPHLASICAFLHRGLKDEQWHQCIARAIDFWTLTLRLMLAQAQALSRHVGTPCLPANQDSYEAIERALAGMLVKLPPDQLACWRPYIGTGGKKGGIGRRFLEKGSESLRRKRNQFVHNASLTPGESVFDELRESLFHVMDAAAFWASFPMVTQVEQRDHGFQGDFLQGSAYPWPRRELVASADTHFDKEHVYLKWRNDNGEVEWIDLWPFIHTEFDRHLGRHVIWVVGNRWEDHWYRCSLQTGETARWHHPPEDALQVLYQG